MLRNQIQSTANCNLVTMYLEQIYFVCLDYFECKVIQFKVFPIYNTEAFILSSYSLPNIPDYIYNTMYPYNE